VDESKPLVGGACVFAVTGYRAPPQHWNLSLGLAFGTSIVWISCAATELLECLTTLGRGLPSFTFQLNGSAFCGIGARLGAV
jgi:hypothetical protein